MTEPGSSRRERNKQEKLERITQAAQELLAEHGLSGITTQQVADRADVATGTLFLYARNKGELLLLAQNAGYEQALERGTAAASTATTPIEAVMAIVEQVVRCNRQHVENGRAYLREMVFGDPQAPHNATALALSRRTELAVATNLERLGRSPQEAAARARLTSAVLFLAMASPLATDSPADTIIEDIRAQLADVIDPHDRDRTTGR